MGLICASLPAEAASVDCVAASTAQEKLICSYATLLKLDKALAAIFDASISELAPVDVSVLRDSQRAWQESLRDTCLYGIGDFPGCLRNAYRARILELAGGVQVRGPYAFTTIRREYWSADLADCESNEPIRRQIAYMQFVAPLSAAQATWNRDTAAFVEREAREWLEGDMRCNPEFYYDVTVDAAMEGFLSVSYGVTWMGIAHPYDAIDHRQLLLATGKSLQPEDLFDDAKPWRQKLAEIVAAKLQPGARSPFEAKDIISQVDGGWVLSPEQLTVTIDFYQMTGGWSGKGVAEIPWPELKPYLRHDLPIPLKLD